MPFCCQCGNAVRAADTYCARCGAAQPAASGGAARRPAPDPAAGLKPRTAALLCYIPLVGWIAAVIVLASARFRHHWNVRFHAFQALYLFVAWLVVDWVLDPFFRVPFPGPHVGSFPGGILKIVIFGCWIFMIIKVSHDEDYKLPIVGELAERSLSEQR